MTTALLIRKPDLAIALTEDAIALKNEALEVAALVGNVANPEQQETAVAAQHKLKFALDMIERARKVAKAPLVNAGRQLDDVVKHFRIDLENEWGRIQDIVGVYQREEYRRASEERERQRLELERIEREKQEALKTAATHEHKQAIEEQAALQARTVEQPVAPIKAKGQVVTEDWEITVTNPYELAKFHPDCVNISPRLTEIKVLLNQKIQVKGVKAERIIKAGVRAEKQPKAILV